MSGRATRCVGVLGASAAAWLLPACDTSKKTGAAPVPSAVAASPSAIASTLGIDAAILADTSDPAPPAGDLKAEIERFVSVETCVKERASLDPLVGDGLRAIGYDTFLRDTCRLLEASKDKRRETCDRIDASALRTRCQSWVAMVAQTPDACPLRFEGIATRGRDVTCLAVAGKDPRLCAGEGRSAQRTTCDALASRDEARCDQATAGDRASCKREVMRWRSVLGEPLAGLPKLAPPHGKLAVKGASGTADPKTPETDLAPDLARGAVVVTSHDRARVEIGMVGESEAWKVAASPNRRARLGIALLTEPGRASKDTTTTLERVELELPGEATLVHPGARCDCRITSARVDRTRGGEVTIALRGTIESGARSYRVDVELSTFVRDVVNEQLGSRVLPPIHPTTGATPTSARSNVGALDASVR